MAQIISYIQNHKLVTSLSLLASCSIGAYCFRDKIIQKIQNAAIAMALRAQSNVSRTQAVERLMENSNRDSLDTFFLFLPVLNRRFWQLMNIDDPKEKLKKMKQERDKLGLKSISEEEKTLWEEIKTISEL